MLICNRKGASFSCEMCSHAEPHKEMRSWNINKGCRKTGRCGQISGTVRCLNEETLQNLSKTGVLEL